MGEGARLGALRLECKVIIVKFANTHEHKWNFTKIKHDDRDDDDNDDDDNYVDGERHSIHHLVSY